MKNFSCSFLYIFYFVNQSDSVWTWTWCVSESKSYGGMYLPPYFFLPQHIIFFKKYWKLKLIYTYPLFSLRWSLVSVHFPGTVCLSDGKMIMPAHNIQDEVGCMTCKGCA